MSLPVLPWRCMSGSKYFPACGCFLIKGLRTKRATPVSSLRERPRRYNTLRLNYISRHATFRDVSNSWQTLKPYVRAARKEKIGVSQQSEQSTRPNSAVKSAPLELGCFVPDYLWFAFSALSNCNFDYRRLDKAAFCHIWLQHLVHVHSVILQFISTHTRRA